MLCLKLGLLEVKMLTINEIRERLTRIRGYLPTQVSVYTIDELRILNNKVIELAEEYNIFLRRHPADEMVSSGLADIRDKIEQICVSLEKNGITSLKKNPILQISIIDEKTTDKRILISYREEKGCRELKLTRLQMVKNRDEVASVRGAVAHMIQFFSTHDKLRSRAVCRSWNKLISDSLATDYAVPVASLYRNKERLSGVFVVNPFALTANSEAKAPNTIAKFSADVNKPDIQADINRAFENVIKTREHQDIEERRSARRSWVELGKPLAMVDAIVTLLIILPLSQRGSNESQMAWNIAGGVGILMFFCLCLLKPILNSCCGNLEADEDLQDENSYVRLQNM